jgi:hypothetical protein
MAIERADDRGKAHAAHDLALGDGVSSRSDPGGRPRRLLDERFFPQKNGKLMAEWLALRKDRPDGRQMPDRKRRSAP